MCGGLPEINDLMICSLLHSLLKVPRIERPTSGGLELSCSACVKQFKGRRDAKVMALGVTLACHSDIFPTKCIEISAPFCNYGI